MLCSQMFLHSLLENDNQCYTKIIYANFSSGRLLFIYMRTKKIWKIQTINCNMTAQSLFPDCLYLLVANYNKWYPKSFTQTSHSGGGFSYTYKRGVSMYSRSIACLQARKSRIRWLPLLRFLSASLQLLGSVLLVRRKSRIAEDARL